MDQSQLFPEGEIGSRGTQLLEAFRYWAGGWWKFNLAAALAGLLPLLFQFGADYRSWFYVAPYALAWAVVGNGLYTVGYTLESILICKTGLAARYRALRPLLFFAGTAGFALVTASIGMFGVAPFPVPD